MGSSDLLRGAGMQLGPVVLAEPVLTTWGIMFALVVGSWIGTRRLSLDPGPVQVVLEGLLGATDRRSSRAARTDGATALHCHRQFTMVQSVGSGSSPDR